MSFDIVVYFIFFFFFFQAEDGIRDGRVTGVQTCALPILDVPTGGVILVQAGTALQAVNHGETELMVYAYGYPPESENAELLERSEERRVGKECRSRW